MRIAVACLLLATVAGCTRTTPMPRATRYRSLSHVVVCWLKQPRDSAAAGELILASQEFRKLPGVVDVFAGIQYSSATTRPIDDISFDVLIVMTFERPEALEAYQQSLEHQRAVKETLQPLTNRVIVYDAIDPTLFCRSWPDWK